MRAHAAFWTFVAEAGSVHAREYVRVRATLSGKECVGKDDAFLKNTQGKKLRKAWHGMSQSERDKRMTKTPDPLFPKTPAGILDGRTVRYGQEVHDSAHSADDTPAGDDIADATSTLDRQLVPLHEVQDAMRAASKARGRFLQTSSLASKFKMSKAYTDVCQLHPDAHDALQTFASAQKEYVAAMTCSGIHKLWDSVVSRGRQAEFASALSIAELKFVEAVDGMNSANADANVSDEMILRAKQVLDQERKDWHEKLTSYHAVARSNDLKMVDPSSTSSAAFRAILVGDSLLTYPGHYTVSSAPTTSVAPPPKKRRIDP